MARTEEEIQELLAKHRELSKGVAVDADEKGIHYQKSSEIKPPQLPWWFVAHIKAYEEHAKQSEQKKEVL